MTYDVNPVDKRCSSTGNLTAVDEVDEFSTECVGLITVL